LVLPGSGKIGLIFADLSQFQGSVNAQNPSVQRLGDDARSSMGHWQRADSTWSTKKPCIILKNLKRSTPPVQIQQLVFVLADPRQRIHP